MKVAKIKNKKENKKVEIEEKNYSLKNMLKIVLIILITFIVFYLITFLVIKNDKKEVSNNNITEIDSTMITLSNLLNKSEEEYYVLAYKTKLENEQTNYKTLYDNYISKYSQTADSFKFYYVDIDDALNKKYIGDDLNITDSLDDLKINDEVLFKIKNNKIEKYYVGNAKILDKLSRL